jgi:hypothetical protein
MMTDRKKTMRWSVVLGASLLIFTGGWFTGHSTARVEKVVIEPSEACLASSQYGRVYVARERQENLILLNQEEHSDEKVRELLQANAERKQKASVLWRSFEDQCQVDLQEGS